MDVVDKKIIFRKFLAKILNHAQFLNVINVFTKYWNDCVYMCPYTFIYAYYTIWIYIIVKILKNLKVLPCLPVADSEMMAEDKIPLSQW